jgi:hypothetical protein
MAQRDYNRYAILVNSNGTTDMMPFVQLPVNQSDKFENWNTEFSRLDKIANKYYGNPFYDFLILYANGYMNEFDIPDGALIRIPFPLAKVKADYEAALTAFRSQ